MDAKSCFDKYIDTFAHFADYARQHEPQPFFDLRNAAFQRYKSAGQLPNSLCEKYRHAALEELYRNEYDFSPIPKDVFVDLNEYFHCEIEDLDTYVVLMSNGAYYEQNHGSGDLPDGVVVCNLKEAKQKYPDLVQRYYGRSTTQANDTFADLNTMFAADGLFVYVPDNVTLTKSIQIVNLTHGFGNKNIFQRNLVVVGQNAALSLIVCDHTLNNSHNFVVDVTESHLCRGATMKYHVLQNEPNLSGVINSHFVTLGEQSHFDSFVLSFHGGLIRNNLHVQYAGERAATGLYGLNLTDRQQRIDNYTLVDHLVPNCSTLQLYKGILDDEAQGSFYGKIIVRPGAVHTEAMQTNRNLCLTGTTKMRTKPQLEIYADDVKCNHGATVGRLDETALFYLRQRGIGLKEAKLMLMFAFANDILLKMDILPLRAKVASLINSRLRGEFSDCNQCLLNCHSRK